MTDLDTRGMCSHNLADFDGIGCSSALALALPFPSASIVGRFEQLNMLLFSWRNIPNRAVIHFHGVLDRWKFKEWERLR